MKSIQLRGGKYILGCSVTTCNEPVYVDLDLKTIKVGKIFVN